MLRDAPLAASLPENVRRAIFGEMSLDEKRAAIETSMSNWRRCHLPSRGLLSMLGDASLDATHCLMHLVTAVCSVEALAALSAASRWHNEHCRTHLHEHYVATASDLAGWLAPHSEPGHDQLETKRCLTIPDRLPSRLRPLLGTWLQTNGRLAHVTSVRCRSFVLTGELVGWIELESVRAGEHERMSPDERFTLDCLDTHDGLLNTVLKYAHRQ